MKRIPIGELEYESDGLYYHRGVPFAGAIIFQANDGWVQAEHEYRDGLLWGTKREWHRPGVLAVEAQCAWGAQHGLCREWHENGQLAAGGTYEYGIRLQERRWGEDGNLVEDYLLRETDPAFRTLQLSRAAFGAGEVGTEASGADGPPGPEVA